MIASQIARERRSRSRIFSRPARTSFRIATFRSRMVTGAGAVGFDAAFGSGTGAGVAAAPDFADFFCAVILLMADFRAIFRTGFFVGFDFRAGMARAFKPHAARDDKCDENFATTRDAPTICRRAQVVSSTAKAQG